MSLTSNSEDTYNMIKLGLENFTFRSIMDLIEKNDVTLYLYRGTNVPLKIRDFEDLTLFQMREILKKQAFELQGYENLIKFNKNISKS